MFAPHYMCRRPPWDHTRIPYHNRDMVPVPSLICHATKARRRPWFQASTRRLPRPLAAFPVAALRRKARSTHRTMSASCHCLDASTSAPPSLEVGSMDPHASEQLKGVDESRTHLRDGISPSGHQAIQLPKPTAACPPIQTCERENGNS